MDIKEVTEEKITVDIDVVSDRRRGFWSYCENVSYLLNQFLIGFVTIYLSWTCLRNGLRGINLHMWLCSTGFSFLMAEGVMTHCTGNLFTVQFRRPKKTTIHWILQGVGGALGIAGGVVEMSRMPVHFVTTHGKLGFSALILCSLGMVSGLSALYSKNLNIILTPLLSKTLHNFLGISAFTVALVAQYYGYESRSFKSQVPEDFLHMIGVITLISLVLSIYGSVISLWSKFLNCFE